MAVTTMTTTSTAAAPQRYTLLINLLISFILVTISAPALNAGAMHTITVPEGDTQALIAAVDEANKAPANNTTIIRVSGLYEFAAENLFSPVSGSIIISGQPGAPATFDAGTISSSNSMSTRGPDYLFRVLSGGNLTLSYLDIANFSLSGHYSREQFALFENAGKLLLESIQFKHVVGAVVNPGVTGTTAHALIENLGDLMMDSVAFVDVGLHILTVKSGLILSNQSSARLSNVLVLFEADYLQSEISNEGELVVLNSTFIGDADRYSHPIRTNLDGRTKVGNSVFIGHNGDWCADAESLGHNVHTHPACDFQAEGDIVNVKLATVEQETVAVAWHGSNPHHLAATPKPGSILIDSADPALCPASDLLGQSRFKDGDGDGIASCDRGAVEFSGTILETGGITGYYYDRSSDGHYIYVLDNPHNVLITWNTFDRLGRQAWIYATGELQENRYLEADAYINLNGQLTDFGPVDIERAEYWGRIRIEFDSCLKGHFWFESSSPDFGSGELEFDRLAYAKQLGCVD